jgi:hypothetical protein
MYFLATAVVTLLVIVSAITAFYDAPEGSDDTDFDVGFVQADEDRQDYNRNVSLILQVTSAGLFATAILGLGSRFNTLRAALMLGGLGVYLTGVGFWASSSDQWLGFLTTVVNFAVLGIGFMWLEEGLPLQPGGDVRRLEIPPAGPAGAPGAPPPPPPPPPPSFSPPPRALPPDLPADDAPAAPRGDQPSDEITEED